MEQELIDATTTEHWLKALDATTALEPFVDPALVDKRVQSSYPGDKVLPALREFRESRKKRLSLVTKAVDCHDKAVDRHDKPSPGRRLTR